MIPSGLPKSYSELWNPSAIPSKTNAPASGTSSDSAPSLKELNQIKSQIKSQIDEIFKDCINHYDREKINIHEIKDKIYLFLIRYYINHSDFIQDILKFAKEEIENNNKEFKTNLIFDKSSFVERFTETILCREDSIACTPPSLCPLLECLDKEEQNTLTQRFDKLLQRYLGLMCEKSEQLHEKQPQTWNELATSIRQCVSLVKFYDFPHFRGVVSEREENVRIVVEKVKNTSLALLKKIPQYTSSEEILRQLDFFDQSAGMLILCEPLIQQERMKALLANVHETLRNHLINALNFDMLAKIHESDHIRPSFKKILSAIFAADKFGCGPSENKTLKNFVSCLEDVFLYLFYLRDDVAKEETPHHVLLGFFKKMLAELIYHNAQDFQQKLIKNSIKLNDGDDYKLANRLTILANLMAKHLNFTFSVEIDMEIEDDELVSLLTQLVDSTVSDEQQALSLIKTWVSKQDLETKISFKRWLNDKTSNRSLTVIRKGSLESLYNQFLIERAFTH